jgi:hypothetical protein
MMHLLVDIGGTELDVTVQGTIDDVDLDGTFAATCNETGERLAINGWLADEITLVDA